VFIWIIIRLLPVLTIGLLAIATLSGSRGRRDGSDEKSDRRFAIRFGRGLTLFSCITATFLTIATSSAALSHSTLFVHLNLWCLIIGPLAGLGGLALFVMNARGLERVLGPFAALLALSNILFFVWIELQVW
jgi:hypothetical protein